LTIQRCNGQYQHFPGLGDKRKTKKLFAIFWSKEIIQEAMCRY